MLTNPDSVDHRAMPPRPDFMIVLGLMPPYMEDDVKQAFLEKVKAAHPDHGGSPEAFGKLEDAYQQALQYVSFRSDRRGWIGARMEEYLAQQSVISDLEEKGANVVIESIDWLQRSFGEFATLTERVIAVQIADKSQATDVLNVVKQEHDEGPAWDPQRGIYSNRSSLRFERALLEGWRHLTRRQSSARAD